MKKLLASVFAVAAISFLSGCSGEVNKVKGGIMADHPQATIGDIFKDNFDGGSWASEKKDGKTIVKFTGKISKKLHNKTLDDFDTVNALWRSLQGKKSRFDLELDAKIIATLDTTGEMKKAVEEEDAAMKQIKQLTNDFNKIDNEKKSHIEALESKNFQLNQTPGKADEAEAVWQQVQSATESYNKWRKEAKKKLDDATSPLHDQERTAYFKRQEMQVAWQEKAEELKKTLVPELAGKYWMPIGSPVEFQWIVYPDGEKFELTSLSNDSWKEYGMGIKTVFDCLYKN